MESLNAQSDYISNLAIYSDVAHSHRTFSLSRNVPVASFTPANTAKRRTYGPSLLSSPARLGYSPNLTSIFRNARTDMADMKGPPIESMRNYLALRNQPSYNPDGVVKYPALTEISNQAPYITTTACPRPHENGKNGAKNLETPDYGQTSQSAHGRYSDFSARQQRQYTASSFGRVGTSDQVQNSSATIQPNNQPCFDVRPGQPEIVSMHDIPSIQAYTDSTSSASWTGDREFYKPRVLPEVHSRCSVPEWLDRLPLRPGEFERFEQAMDYDSDSDGDVEYVTLSPHVEVERGNKRPRRKKRQVKERCVSYNDEDIFD